ncbi:MAG TPA: M56 family metallopeptidase [Candidatus Cybelea sp.]
MIAGVLLNGLWQGAPLVAIAWLVTRLIPRSNAATRYAIWFATLLALVIVPILATASHAGASLAGLVQSHGAGSAVKITLVPAGSFVSHADAVFSWAAPVLLGFWFAAAVLALIRLAVSFFRVYAIRRALRPLAGAGRDVWVCDDLSVPIVAGILSPAIVIPSAIANELTPANLQRIVAHERAHIRRYDPLCNLIARAVEALLILNPWVYLAGRNLCLEREAACDDWVVESVGSPGEYAACLALLAQSVRSRNAPLLTPTAFHSRRTLIERIERLGSNEPRRLTINSFAIGGAVMLFLIATIVLQALSPALALTPAVPKRLVVAATCAHPVVEASATDPAPPMLPHGLAVSGTTEVLVTLAPDGHVLKTSVVKSSGNKTADTAVLEAARKSKYSPEIADCAPVEGAYLFRADFKPSP